VQRLFAAQHFVASTRQLEALGVASRTISWACRQGIVVRVIAGVVRLVGVPASFESDAMAVQLHAGLDGFLSGPTAARLYGLRAMPSAPIFVTTARRARRELPMWVNHVATTWSRPDDVVEQGGFRLEQPLRMLLSLADVFNQHRFEKAAEDAWHLRLITPAAAAEYVESVRGRGRRGLAAVDTWLARTGARSRPVQSHFEFDLVAAVRRVGLPEPHRQYPLGLVNGERIHLDLAWPEVRLAVEPGHSWWHGGDLKMRADAARDRACSELGWLVLRYDEAARADLAAAAAEIRRVYATRRSTANSGRL